MREGALNLIFLGAPGSGKGTQAMKLVQERKYNHISTGNLLRKEVESKTPLGEQVEAILKEGQLVNDGLIFELLEKNCHLDKFTYIFDGFPRNKNQAEMLDERLLGGYPYRVVYFNLSAEKLVERLINRRMCGDCGKIYNLISRPPSTPDICDSCGQKALYHREDDHEDIIRNRMMVYNEAIASVLDYYGSQSLLVEVAANHSTQEIYRRMVDALWQEK